MGDTLLAEFQQINDKAAELYGKNEIKEFTADFFAEDCRYMPPGCDVIFGREDVQKAHESIFQAGFVNPIFKVLEVIPLNEEYVIQRASFNMYNKDGELNDEGKLVTLWKKVDGKWQSNITAFNSNRPSGGVTVSSLG